LTVFFGVSATGATGAATATGAGAAATASVSFFATRFATGFVVEVFIVLDPVERLVDILRTNQFKLTAASQIYGRNPHFLKLLEPYEVFFLKSLLILT
jgi:hypothetical protein